MFSRVSGLFWIAGLLSIGAVGALWFNRIRSRDTLNWVEHTSGTPAIVSGLIVLAILSTAFGVFLLKRQQIVEQRCPANERSRSARESRTSREAYLEAILATVPDAVIAFDKAGTIDFFSATAERLFQMSADEARGRSVSSLFPKPAAQELDDFIIQHQARRGQAMPRMRELLIRRKDDSTVPVELSVGEAPLDGGVQLVAFVRDLTDRRTHGQQTEELQGELLHVTHLTNIGEIASAFAHELNQPLTALGLYLHGAQLLLGQAEGEKAAMAKAAIQMAAHQALRVGQVIRRLRTLVIGGETEKRVESLTRMVQEAFALTIPSKDQSVRVDLALDPSVDLVLADKIQIQQVLLNLMRNSLEAMKDAPRRELLVTSAPASDGMVKVSVADTGSGIAPEIAAKLFQPFMTTKKDGLGVGLSISRTIIEAHYGRIEAEPSPGGGTVFRFTLRSGLLKDEADDG